VSAVVEIPGAASGVGEVSAASEVGEVGEVGSASETSETSEVGEVGEPGEVDESALRAVPPSLVLARRRPIAVALVYLWGLAWAFVVAEPAHAWARRVWGAHPDGDAVLFRDGGRELLAWIDTTDSAPAVVLRVTMLLLVVGAVVGQIPLGALLASLTFGRGSRAVRSPRISAAVRAGVTAFVPLVTLLVLTGIVQGIVLGLGFWISSLVDHGLAERLGDARSFQLRVVVLGLFAVPAVVLGVFVDLARAAVVRDLALGSGAAPSPLWTVLRRALGAARVAAAARGALWKLTGAWAIRAAAGGALALGGYLASSALGGRGGAALVGLFFVHQAVVLGRTALRASWLARAVARVAGSSAERERGRESA